MTMFGKKAGLASIAEGRSDVHKIDPRKLNVRDGWNSRDFNDADNVAHIEMLAQSIATQGVIDPIKVNWEDGKAWIVNGECRYRATMLCIERGIDVKTVPVVGHDRNANEADRLFTQYLSNTGKPFTQLETANHFKRLLNLGWQQDDIAKKAGLSQGRVSQILSLLTMPERVKEMVIAGEVTTSLAMQTVKSEGSQAEKVLKDGLEAAKAEGQTRVRPNHVGKQSLKTVIVDMLDSGDIDDDSDCVILKVPAEKWEALKALLKY